MCLIGVVNLMLNVAIHVGKPHGTVEGWNIGILGVKSGKRSNLQEHDSNFPVFQYSTWSEPPKLKNLLPTANHRRRFVSAKLLLSEWDQKERRTSNVIY